MGLNAGPKIFLGFIVVECRRSQVLVDAGCKNLEIDRTVSLCPCATSVSTWMVYSSRNTWFTTLWIMYCVES